MSKRPDDSIAAALAALTARGFVVAQPIQTAPVAAKPAAPNPYGIGAPIAVVLREMARHAVWLERGGLAMRERSKYQTGGAVVGRTIWAGMPEWARGFGYDRAAIVAITEKAIAGARLGKRQRLLLQAMLDTIAESDRWTEENPDS